MVLIDMIWPTIKWIVAVVSGVAVVGLSILFSWLGVKTPFKWRVF